MNNLVWDIQRNLEDASELFEAYVNKDTRPPEIRTKCIESPRRNRRGFLLSNCSPALEIVEKAAEK
jgi:hypothetical protein